ncbi:MAG: DUF3445 domain-containing protein [Opitutaceae bacterium]|nr:DUF3445 domain-containing protein [Opitutaceae bacterium]
MPLPLAELFPDEDYRFHLTLRKGDLAEFFASPDPAALAERRVWLERDFARYGAATPAAGALLDELATWTEQNVGGIGAIDRAPTESWLGPLGRTLVPDFMLLTREGAGFRLHAAMVCFPSSWEPAAKVGLDLDAIHQVVPGLNVSLGATIGQFLGKLRPGVAYERANWGLAASPERNLHPALGRPRLALPLAMDRIWVRIEDQILGVLPATGAILFGIRLRIIPLTDILAEPKLRCGFRRALATLPDELAAYKGLATVREALVARLA